MSESKDKPVYFYESPDGGETIYRRESGSEERVLVKGGNNTIYDMIQENLEDTSEILIKFFICDFYIHLL